MLKGNLDRRICDCEEGVPNTQTYREFIRYAEDDLGLEEKDLDCMNSYELEEYLDYIDYLYSK